MELKNMSTTAAIQLAMKLIPADQLQSVYGYSELNEKLLNALYLKGGPEHHEFLEANLPIHFIKYQANFATMQRIVRNDENRLLRVESTARPGFPFLMIKSDREKIHLVNPLNYSEGDFTIQEASLAMAILTYTLFYENANSEVEQNFCIFMMEYLKDMISHNYNPQIDHDKQEHNISGILSLISWLVRDIGSNLS